MEKEKLIQLVQAAQQGDTRAMDDLFTAFYNDVYYFALKTVKDSELACDITQETFLKVIQNIGELKEPVAFVTWMKQIAYHQCTHYFSKKKEVLVEEDEDGNTVFDTLADDGAMPAEVLEQAEFRQTILSMIAQLTEEQRAAVLLYYFDELTVGQIAQIQGVSEGTVKSRLNYARKAIKKSVESYEEKHGVKLHSVALLPLLLLFFGKEAMPEAKAAAVRENVLGASGNTQAAFAAVTTQTAASKAAAAGGLYMTLAKLPLLVKIIAGIVAAALVVGTGVLVFKDPSHKKIENPGETIADTITEATGEAAGTPNNDSAAGDNTEDDNVENTDNNKEEPSFGVFCGKTMEYDETGRLVGIEVLEYDVTTRTQTLTRTNYRSDGTSDTDSRVYQYDAAGNRIRFVDYGNAGKKETRWEYDAAGNRIAHIVYDVESDQEFVTGKYEYDANNNITRRVDYFKPGAFDIEFRWEYDAAGNMIRKTVYSAPGKVKEAYEYEYDANGKLICETWDGIYVNTSAITKYEYDTAGNLIRVTIYGADGQLGEEDIFEYDAAGNMTREAHYGFNGDSMVLDSEQRWEYDAAGNMVRRVYLYDNHDGTVYSDECRWEYDAAGNEISYKTYDAAGKLHSESRREYDADGNVTRILCYDENGKLEWECRYENYQNIPFLTLKHEHMPF